MKNKLKLTNTKNLSYFAADGNYGSADNLALVDTDEWTNEDWQDVDEAGDNDRLDVAKRIQAKRKSAVMKA